MKEEADAFTVVRRSTPACRLRRFGGGLLSSAATRFGVSVSSASRGRKTVRQDGQLTPKPSGGDHASHQIEAQAELILTTYEARPAIFLHEMRDTLAKRGVQTSTSSLSRFFDRHGNHP